FECSGAHLILSRQLAKAARGCFHKWTIIHVRQEGRGTLVVRVDLGCSDRPAFSADNVPESGPMSGLQASAPRDFVGSQIVDSVGRTERQSMDVESFKCSGPLGPSRQTS